MLEDGKIFNLLCACDRHAEAFTSLKREKSCPTIDFDATSDDGAVTGRLCVLGLVLMGM